MYGSLLVACNYSGEQHNHYSKPTHDKNRLRLHQAFGLSFRAKRGIFCDCAVLRLLCNKTDTALYFVIVEIPPRARLRLLGRNDGNLIVYSVISIIRVKRTIATVSPHTTGTGFACAKPLACNSEQSEESYGFHRDSSAFRLGMTSSKSTHDKNRLRLRATLGYRSVKKSENLYSLNRRFSCTLSIGEILSLR